MTLLRRAPREVYRVYDEDEYLAGATWEPGVESASAKIPADLRRRRALSAAILLGAVGAVGSVIALNSLSQSRVASRRTATAGKPVAPSGSRELAQLPSERRSTAVPPRVPPSWRPQTRGRTPSPIHGRVRRSRQVVELAATGATPRGSDATASAASGRAEPVEFGFER